MHEVLCFNYTEEEVWEMLKQDATAIGFINNPTEEMIEYAVMRNPFSIGHVENPSDNVIGLAVAQKPQLIKSLPQSERICMVAINKDASVLRFVKEQTEGICLLALLNSVDGQREMIFEDIKVRTQKVCETAVRLSPSIIQQMKDQSEEFYNSMIKVNWEVIRYMESPSIEQCLLAYEQDKRALDYLKI